MRLALLLSFSIAAGLAAGISLGIKIGRRDAPPAASAAALPERAEDDEGDGNDDDARVDERPGALATASAREVARAFDVEHATRAQLVARVRELEKANARLSGTVADNRAEKEAVEGTPIAFPEGHSKQADSDAFHKALVDALAKAGLAGDIEAMDCNEFPCIAHGTITGDISDDAMQTFVDDAKTRVGWGAPYVSLSRFKDPADPTKNSASFALSLFPEGLPDDEQQNLNKRLRDRKNAYVDAR
jgi:hypothetical protein